MNLNNIKEICKINNIKIDGDHITFNNHTPNIQLTKNFKLQEFLTKNKKDSTTIIDLKIVVELQALRTIYGKAIRITSTYRSPPYNKSINGATSSEHIKGNALDTQPIDGDGKSWLKVVIENKKTGGIGQYNTFVHIDTGKTRYWRG